MRSLHVPGEAIFSAIRRAIYGALNPRYAHLPRRFRSRRISVLDVGSSARGGLIAHRILKDCWYEGVDMINISPSDPVMKYFDRFHSLDLNKAGLALIADGVFDYVICSHTIEHLNDGLTIVSDLCRKVRSGGRLYLEWPSIESQTFPLRGFGLNFFDDSTHQRTFSREQIAELVRHEGMLVEFVGRRRNKLRMLLAPLLVLRRWLRERRLLLYDLWDWVGFCYVVRAVKPTADATGNEDTR